MYSSSLIPLALLALTRLVAGHGAIIAATGDKGGRGMAIGIDPSTPRDGTDDVPFQQDTTVFDGDAEFTCGETDQTAAADTTNQVTAGTQEIMRKTKGQLPQVSQGGKVRMTLHQVNSDGAGPYVCMIDATGTGVNWVRMEVTTQVPGEDGNNDAGETTDFPLVAKVAKDQTCTGVMGNMKRVCMVRCQNPQGPFGGCVPVQMDANATRVRNPRMSETGGTNEDDVNAIVDAAEAEADGETVDDADAGGLLDGLFDKSRMIKSRKLKRSMRMSLRALKRKSRRAARMAAKRAAKMV
jgi:hypothetical protein